MGINIKDIAKMADVSITTVSQVLNGKPIRVSAEKRAKILAIAKEHGYRPNQVAKSLVTKETHIIGLIIPDIENAFFSGLAKAVEDEAQKQGYFVFLMNTNDDHQKHLKVMELLLSRQVDGLLMTIPNESYAVDKQREMRAYLEALRVPVVLVDRVLPDTSLDTVSFDNEKGGFLATSYLLEKGFREIACITGPTGSMSSDMRLSGYLKALKAYGLPFNESLIVEGNYHYPSGKKAVDVLLERKVSFDAVFAFNDLMAYGAKETLHHIGIKDKALMGYDFVFLSKLLGGKLNSVAQDSTLLGKRAFEVLMQRIKHEIPSDPVHVCLSPQLKLF